MDDDERGGSFSVVAELRQQVRYIAVDRGEDAGALEIYLGLV